MFAVSIAAVSPVPSEAPAAVRDGRGVAEAGALLADRAAGAEAAAAEQPDHRREEDEEPEHGQDPEGLGEDQQHDLAFAPQCA